MSGKGYGFRTTLLLLLVLVMPVTSVHGHKSGGFYMGDSIDNDHSDWMSSLPDGWLISKLSVPGTHDTMTFKGVPALKKYSMETQSLDLDTQLDAGIRALDIRLVLDADSDDFNIHHGDIDLDSTFTEVLDIVKAFLIDHPAESILMRLKRERPKGDEDTTDFFSTLDLIIKNYPDLFWLPSGEDTGEVPKWDLTIEVPNLGDVRGKIVIFDDMPQIDIRKTDGELYGLPYIDGNDYFEIQDEFKLDCKQLCNKNLYNKWESIRTHFESAAVSDEKIYINHLSGTGGLFGETTQPWFVASGHMLRETDSARQWTLRIDPPFSDFKDFPRLNCVWLPFAGKTCSIFFEGTNELTYKHIKNWALQDRLGIVMMDFPGPGLIDKIIGFNTGHWSKLVCANGPYDAGEGSQISFKGSPSDSSLESDLKYKWEWNSCDFDDEGVCIPGTEWSHNTGWSDDLNAYYTWNDDFSGTATLWVKEDIVSWTIQHTDETQVTVYNVAPSTTIDLISQTDVTFLLPLADTYFSGSFTDPGSLDTHDGLWDFGDGSDLEDGDLVEENEVPDSTGNVTGSHVYSEPGTYTVSLMVTDDDGGEGSDTETIKVLTAEEAAQVINDFILNCSNDVFKKNPSQWKNAFSNKFKELIGLITAEEYQEAISKLVNDIRDKTDGLKNDWITDHDTQEEVCPMIDALVEYLQNLL